MFRLAPSERLVRSHDDVSVVSNPPSKCVDGMTGICHGEGCVPEAQEGIVKVIEHRSPSFSFGTDVN